MYFEGRGNALLLFYTTGDNAGGAALCTFRSSDGSLWERPLNKIREQVITFFTEGCDQLIRVESQTRRSPQEEKAGTVKDRTSWQPSEEKPTSLTLCKKCGAAIAIGDSTYCWKCGAKLQTHGMEEAPRHEGEAQASEPHREEVGYGRNCMICKLQLREGELLAWCPKCGAPAHRVHMLEWLHVKEDCPACGQHLDAQEVEEQLSHVHVRQPLLPEPRARTSRGRGAIPSKEGADDQRRQTQRAGKQGSVERKRPRQ